MARWCAFCIRDDEESWDKFCPIIAASMGLGAEEDGYPEEWIEDRQEKFSVENQNARCTAFYPDDKAFAERAREMYEKGRDENVPLTLEAHNSKEA